MNKYESESSLTSTYCSYSDSISTYLVSITKLLHHKIYFSFINTSSVINKRVIDPLMKLQRAERVLFFILLWREKQPQSHYIMVSYCLKQENITAVMISINVIEF